MKHFLIWATAVTVFSSCLNNTDKEKIAGAIGQTNNAAAKIDSANFTSIEWLDSAKHMGTITEGAVLKIDYRFKNTGAKPLVIASVRPGCGCTVADYPKEPIAPGAIGTIKAEFDSKGKEGFQSKSISVDANTKEPSTLWFDVTIAKASN